MYTPRSWIKKGVEEYAIECSILKVAVSEDVQTVLTKVSKSMNDSQEIPNGKCLRDARIACIYEGTNEINRMLSVGMLIKKSDEGTCWLIRTCNKGGWLIGIPLETPDYSDHFAEEKKKKKKKKKKKYRKIEKPFWLLR
jgi:hypothetical protein